MTVPYDNFLFDSSGQPVSLSADEAIAFLVQQLHLLQQENSCLKQQLDRIRQGLNASDKSIGTTIHDPASPL
jgi:prefoldin subunit 5